MSQNTNHPRPDGRLSKSETQRWPSVACWVSHHPTLDFRLTVHNERAHFLSTEVHVAAKCMSSAIFRRAFHWLG